MFIILKVKYNDTIYITLKVKYNDTICITLKVKYDIVELYVNIMTPYIDINCKT